MIGRLRQLLGMPDGQKSGPGVPAVDDRHLAAAALLVEVATVDENFDEMERERIIAFATERFDLSEIDAQSLVTTAQGEVHGATQLYAFTMAIKNGFSYEERVALMESLWEVVYADGHADPFEDQLMRRISGLIAVTDRDRGHARKRAQSQDC